MLHHRDHYEAYQAGCKAAIVQVKSCLLYTSFLRIHLHQTVERHVISLFSRDIHNDAAIIHHHCATARRERRADIMRDHHGRNVVLRNNLIGNIHNAVSYTHLDVYKRQRLSCLTLTA